MESHQNILLILKTERLWALLLKKMVDKFNKENKDGIKVKMDISSDFDSQLSTAFAAGEGPTMILSSSAYRFTYGDYLQDVSDVLSYW